MLSVCLIFLYVLLTAYVTGFLVLTGIRSLCKKTGQGLSGNMQIREKVPEAFCAVCGENSSSVGIDSYLMAGLIFTTVYAQFFSLFYKVGLLANVVLLLICIATVIFFRKKLWEIVKAQYKSLTAGRKIVILILFLLFAYGTSRGIIHYDTGLYHAQSIRWTEEYGLVKGLGNLHCRLAYNSASFGLSALYSFSFLGGQSFHCMAGFLAWLLAVVCSEIADAWKRKRLLASDMARLMGIYYLLIIFDEMISPASDYFMVLTVFYIVIRYLDLIEAGEQSWIPYGLLSLACVYVVSIKLSAAFIVLLVIKPAVMMVKDKKVKEIGIFIGLGLMITAPYLIRNVLISGWLVYPFTAIDFFPVDWKIPEGLAAYDAKEIQVWGRGIYDVARYGEPAWQWMPEWFRMQGTIDKLFILAGMVAVPISVGALVFALWKKKEKQQDLLLVAVVINLSFLFWLFSAPLIRYGCVYLWLAPAVTFGILALWLTEDGRKAKLLWRLAYGALLLIGCYKLFAFGKEVVMAYRPEYFLVQKDYENFTAVSYEIEGIPFYYPAEGDRIGYEAFPSSPTEAQIEFRGAGIKDGFRYKVERSKVSK